MKRIAKHALVGLVALLLVGSLTACQIDDLVAAQGTQITELESKLEAAQKELASADQAQKEDYEAQIADLEKEYQAKVAELESADTENKNTIAALQEAYNTKVAELAKADADNKAALDALTATYNAKVAELSAADTENKNTIAALQTAYNTKVAELQKTIANIEKELKAIQTELNKGIPGTDAYMKELDEAGYIPIGSFEELNEKIRNIILDKNADPDQKAAVLAGKYYLTADITVTDVENAMIEGLTGVFDGNGHTIYNTYKWVFDELSGTVKNVYLSAYTDATETDVFTTVDPVCGYNLHDGATLENVVTNRIFTTVSNYWGSFARCVDDNATVTLIGCVNKTDISSPYTVNNHKLGGFFGIVNAGANVTFKECVNNGRIEGSQVGGFIGILNQGKGQTIAFENCLNTGAIIGIIGKMPTGESAYGIAGGFIGGFNNVGIKGPTTDQEMTISFDGCVNRGNVLRYNEYEPCTKTTPITSGGLIGNIGTYSDTIGLNLTVKDCSILNCTIGGEGWDGYTQGYAGAIIGWLENSKGVDSISIDGVTVSNVTVKAGNPATASALLNIASDTNMVVIKNVQIQKSTYTSLATGAYSIENKS